MLQNASINNDDSADNDTTGAVTADNASSVNPSLRLYDSIHLNDPDEGNYLFRFSKEKK